MMTEDKYKAALDAYNEATEVALSDYNAACYEIDRQYVEEVMNVDEPPPVRSAEDISFSYGLTVPNQFRVAGAADACVAIAMIACYWIRDCVLNQVDVEKEPWIKVVKNGARLWESWKSSQTDTKSGSYPLVNEMLKLPTTSSFRKVFGQMATLETGGVLANTGSGIVLTDDSASTLEDLFATMHSRCSTSMHGNCCCVLVIPSKSAVGLVCEMDSSYPSPKFWFFDSHGGGSAGGSFCDLKTSTLAGDVCAHIRRKYASDLPVEGSQHNVMKESSLTCFSASLFCT